MQKRETTHTLLEAQDLPATIDYCDRTGAPAPSTPGKINCAPARHDFLVLSQHPDLTPELLPLAIAGAQSWERNSPQK